MARLRMVIIGATVLLAFGCQTITSDKVVFEPQRPDFPLERLEGTWIDSEGQSFTVRRVAENRFVIESADEDEEPLPISVLPEGGFRADLPPEDGKPQPPVFIDLHKIEDGYLLVAARRELRGRDLSWLMHLRARFEEQAAEVEAVSMLSGDGLYEKLQRRPDLLLHDKRRGRREGEIGRYVTIRLKDDPGKIRRFLLEHLGDAELFGGNDEEPTVYRRQAHPPATRPAGRAARAGVRRGRQTHL